MKKALLLLLRKEALVRETVTLSSGKKSDYYIDVRKVSLSPAGVYLISHLVLEAVSGYEVDAIGGPTLGADPIVSGACFLAHQNKKKLKGFLIRKTPKKHGRQKLIEGQLLSPQDKVILVDDVATSGSSLIKGVEVLAQEKIIVSAALVVVDRQEGAAAALGRLDCPLISLFTKEDILSGE